MPSSSFSKEIFKDFIAFPGLREPSHASLPASRPGVLSTHPIVTDDVLNSPA
jgi:hypothetical protein